jgi:hypothetical protein|nr:MAG TPA: hypothetical protein [Caudoviricetes sp.]
MFPDEITIFNKIENDDETTYHKTNLKNVIWYGTDNINLLGKGIVNSDDINIVIPLESLSDYKKVSEFNELDDKSNFFTLQKEDKIVKGVADDIKSVKELSKYENVVTIKGIEENLFGSSIDNILIKGK